MKVFNKRIVRIKSVHTSFLSFFNSMYFLSYLSGGIFPSLILWHCWHISKIYHQPRNNWSLYIVSSAVLWQFKSSLSSNIKFRRTIKLNFLKLNKIFGFYKLWWWKHLQAWLMIVLGFSLHLAISPEKLVDMQMNLLIL